MITLRTKVKMRIGAFDTGSYGSHTLEAEKSQVIGEVVEDTGASRVRVQWPGITNWSNVYKYDLVEVTDVKKRPKLPQWSIK